MPIVKIKNEEIYYSRSGNAGSPYSLLFIHGATANHTSLNVLEKSLSEYNCILIDLPCHGQSKGKIRKSVETYADFIEDFVLFLQNEQVMSQDLTLVGCSMGGFISLELAVRKFLPVKRLVILSSGADAGTHSEIIPYLTDSLPETFDAKPLLTKSFGPRCNEQFVNAVMQGMMAIGLPNNEICYYDFCTVKDFNKLDEVKDITIPALVITGDSDSIIPPICSWHLFENINSCSLLVIPFSGHTVTLDGSDYIAKNIIDFISIK